MKVRICPKCETHNLENSWECADFGATLSMKTLVDLEDGKPSVVPIAGHQELSSISSYFEEDVVEVLDKVIKFNEPVLWGCNITQITMISPFKFGYIIITSRRLFCVQFNSDVTRKKAASFFALLLRPLSFILREAIGSNVLPKRPWIGDSPIIPAVRYPGYSLSPKEIASREVVICDLRDLTSARFESNWFQDVRLIKLTLGFHQEDEVSFTFYVPHQAQEAKNFLKPWL